MSGARRGDEGVLGLGLISPPMFPNRRQMLALQQQVKQLTTRPKGATTGGRAGPVHDPILRKQV